MDILNAIPEQGVGKNSCTTSLIECCDLCDICMKKRATFDFSCEKHRICRFCQKKKNKRTSPKSCPICGFLVIRMLEKQLGKPYIMSSTYIPIHRISSTLSESKSAIQTFDQQISEESVQFKPENILSPIPLEQDYSYDFNDDYCQLSMSMSIQDTTSAYEESNEDHGLFPSYSLVPIPSTYSSNILCSPLSLEDSSLFSLCSPNSPISG